MRSFCSAVRANVHLIPSSFLSIFGLGLALVARVPEGDHLPSLGRFPRQQHRSSRDDVKLRARAVTITFRPLIAEATTAHRTCYARGWSVKMWYFGYIFLSLWTEFLSPNSERRDGKVESASHITTPSRLDLLVTRSSVEQYIQGGP